MSVRDRVAKHRAEMRSRGLRPIQVWVPDTHLPGFALEAARQSAEVREFDASDDTLDFIEGVSDWPEGET